MTGNEEGYFISRSGTKHIIRGNAALTPGRISALCGFTRLQGEDERLEARRDCRFCQKEAAVARREAEARERIRAGLAEQILN